ncbi:MAG: hypothetical protein ACXVII_44670 [Solirubrobacteraceae bacterium]
MRRPLLIALLMYVWLAASWLPSASASAPLAGGLYESLPSRSDPGTVIVSLLLADDAREFSRASFVGVLRDCGEYSEETYYELDYRTGPPYLATPISRTGVFRASKGKGRWIRGHFAQNGRRVVGTVYFPAYARCPAVRTSFQARLKGRPNAAHPGSASACDEVPTGKISTYELLSDYYNSWQPLARHLGCTNARRLTRSFVWARQCGGLTVGDACVTPQARCRGIRGGVFNRLASVSCRPRHGGRGTAEAAYRGYCSTSDVHAEGVTLTRSLWVFNTRCATAAAFPIIRLIVGAALPPGSPQDTQRKPACPDNTFSDNEERCPTFAGYRCTKTWSVSGNTIVYTGHCISARDSFRAFDFTAED